MVRLENDSNVHCANASFNLMINLPFISDSVSLMKGVMDPRKHSFACNFINFFRSAANNTKMSSFGHLSFSGFDDEMQGKTQCAGEFPYKQHN